MYRCESHTQGQDLRVGNTVTALDIFDVPHSELFFRLFRVFSCTGTDNITLFVSLVLSQVFKILKAEHKKMSLHH